jgi:hypothetical protein
MESAGEQEAANALINSVDKQLEAFKQQSLKNYSKKYYSIPKNRNRRNNYNKQYYLLLKSKKLK